MVAIGAWLTEVPSLQLFDLIYREETLFNVIKSVTRNGRSILLTALLALILVYLFSIVGFLFLKDDFILEVDRLPGNHSRGLGDFCLGWACGVTIHMHRWQHQTGHACSSRLPAFLLLDFGRSSLYQPASPHMNVSSLQSERSAEP